MMGGFNLLSESKRKWGNVAEDSFRYSKKRGEICLAVADGVSRDPFNNYPDLNTEQGKKLMIKNYPKPSLAKKAADIVVSSSDLYLANKKLAVLNEWKIPDPNWLKEDFAGCTASLAKIKGDKLFYQFIGCCGVTVINRSGKVKFQTPDEYWPEDEKRWKLIKQAEFIKGFIKSLSKDHSWWRRPEGRILIRRFFRNKPKQKYSFGILTGEKEAQEYIREGNLRLEAEDTVLVYSDGLQKPLFTKESLKIIKEKDFSKLKEFCKSRVDSEGTIVYWTS